MNTLEIRRTCRGCGKKDLKNVDDDPLPSDYCRLAGKLCSDIKECHPDAKTMEGDHEDVDQQNGN